MRRVLTVCIPLCLCLVIVSAAMLPHAFYICEDYTPPAFNNGAISETADSIKATVYDYDTGKTSTVSQADKLYATVLTMFDSVISNGGTLDNSSSPEDGAEKPESSEESFYVGAYEDDEDFYPIYVIRFDFSDGNHVFQLQNNWLFDNNSGNYIALNNEQRQLLMTYIP